MNIERTVMDIMFFVSTQCVLHMNYQPKGW